MTFSEQLRAIRAEKQYTQRDAYTALGVPQRTYEHWEGGDRTPPDYIQRIILRQLAAEKPSC